MDDFVPHDTHLTRHLSAVGSEPAHSQASCGDWSEPDNQWAMSHRADLFRNLIEAVGGAEPLMCLHAEPLPDESFDWTGVDERDTEFVSEVLVATDQFCATVLDSEFRTIIRRILAQVATRDPRALRRSTNVVRCAAGLVWLAGRASGEFGNRSRVSARLVWSWFGVNDCSDRGRSLRRAADLEPDEHSFSTPSWTSRPTLGDPELLHSRYRAELIARRDLLVGIANERRKWRKAPGGTARVQAVSLRPLLATKGIAGNRAMIVAGFGDDLDDATFQMFSITEARDLVTMLQAALDAPLPKVR